MTAQRAVSRLFLTLIFIAFVGIGLPDAIFGVAWPLIRAEFDVTNATIGFINIPASLVYLASSATSGALVSRLGLARLLTLSTATVGVGLILYAATPNFWIIIPSTMLLAGGSGAIDAALNLVASERLSTRYMSWLHAFYGTGALTGPFIMAAAFGLGASWRWGYATIAMIVLLLSVVFFLTRQSWRRDPDDPQGTGSALVPVSAGEVLRIPRVWLSLGMIFSEAMIECLASLWIASTMIQRFGQSDVVAGVWAGVYWVALTVARIFVPILWQNAATVSVLRASSVGVLIAALLMLPESLILYGAGIVLIGLSNASMFPAIMSITPQRFGSSVATHAVGFHVSTSTIAFALMPTISGAFADRFGMIIIPVMILVAAVAVLAIQATLRRGDPANMVTAPSS